MPKTLLQFFSRYLYLRVHLRAKKAKEKHLEIWEIRSLKKYNWVHLLGFLPCWCCWSHIFNFWHGHNVLLLNREKHQVKFHIHLIPQNFAPLGNEWDPSLVPRVSLGITNHTASTCRCCHWSGIWASAAPLMMPLTFFTRWFSIPQSGLHIRSTTRVLLKILIYMWTT